MPAEAPVRRVHLWSGLIVLGVFLAGAATGAALCVRLRPPGPPPPRARHLAGLPPHFAALDLTPEQLQRARAIAEKYRPAMEAVVRETFPRVRAVQEQMERELRSLLTEAQARKLDGMKATRPPPPDGPRPPGLPGFPPFPGGPAPGAPPPP